MARSSSPSRRLSVFVASLALAATLFAGVPAEGVTEGGTWIWVERFTSPGTGFDQGWAVAVSPDGSTVFVTGGSAGETSDPDYATLS